MNEGLLVVAGMAGALLMVGGTVDLVRWLRQFAQRNNHNGKGQEG